MVTVAGDRSAGWGVGGRWSRTVGVLLAVISCGGIVGAMLSTNLTRRFGTASGLLPDY